MPLSTLRNITIGAISTTLSVAVLAIVYQQYRKRKISTGIHSFIDDDDDYASDDTQCHTNRRVSNGGDTSSHNPNASARSMSEKQLNLFNSSRLNQDLPANNSMSQLHDLSATKLLPDGVKFIPYRKLHELIKKHSKDIKNIPKYVIFDLRSPEIDYNGGHIVDSILLPDKLFYDDISNIFNKYHNIESIIMQCMDGCLRSIENIEYYSKARKQVGKYYDSESKMSYYYKYTLKIQHHAHKTVMRSIKFDNEEWMKEFVSKEKIIVDFNGKEEMYSNLMKQKLFVVAGGFFDFLNFSVAGGLIDLEDNNGIIEGFNNEYWEELTVMGQKKLYHKTEYYTTRRINPLRKTQTKASF